MRLVVDRRFWQSWGRGTFALFAAGVVALAFLFEYGLPAVASSLAALGHVLALLVLAVGTIVSFKWGKRHDAKRFRELNDRGGQ